jgi:alpha,alpha-trehalase
VAGGAPNEGGALPARRSAVVAASNFIPVWALGVRGAVAPERADAVAAALNASGLVAPGGVLTSLDESSGQQWDAPNAWAPLQSLIIEGLNATARPAAAALAERIAKRWLRSGRANLLRDGFLNEKSDGRTADGLSGRGGEYAPQLGFGWSIGVCLDLLVRTDYDNLDEEAAPPGPASEAWPTAEATLR